MCKSLIMSRKIIKEFNGFSKSKIFLIESHGKLFVEKKFFISRNVKQLKSLSSNFKVPKILNVKKNSFEMEYIHGLDMASYLDDNDAKPLAFFIEKTLNKLSRQKKLGIKDYNETYVSFLKTIKFYGDLPFTAGQLIKKLPRFLPQSQYHGDLTLENIIYSKKFFYLIDCSEGIFDSFIFDYSKLRQDIELKWFLRKRKAYFEVKLKYIYDYLKKTFKYMDNNPLLILMLLRVLKHTKKNSFEYNFLISNINQLWK